MRLPVRTPGEEADRRGAPSGVGRGEATLTDVDVRDTWELTPDQITLGGSDWPALMNRALEDLRDQLGLSPTTRLRAEPHAMLVYGRGQFFLPHQDSEKDDTLVDSTGGVAAVGAHRWRTGHRARPGSTSCRASKEELTFVAFYADCRHRVTPVRSGFRVTLTFNLLADAERPAAETGGAAELADCLTEHFTTPTTTRYASRDLVLPNRLVFLLDHEYTQRGLAWHRLKGDDAKRAALVRAAAKRAGCEAVLALAEVRETWDALPSGSDRWDDYGYYEDEVDGTDDRSTGEDPDDYRLNDLIGRAVRRGLDPQRGRRLVPARRSGRNRAGRVDRRPAARCLRSASHHRGAEVARLLTDGAWHWMVGQLRLWTATPRNDVRQPQLERLSSPLAQLVGAADDQLRDEIAAALRECGDTVLDCLVPALRLADARRTAGLDMVARDCAERLGAILARPPRADDDWSIEWTGCECGLCATLRAFLGSRTEQTFEWALKAEGRQHVHNRIDSAGLPVRHQTRRQGRPYTLVLTKTEELFTRATNACHNAAADLAWLTSTEGGASLHTRHEP